MTPNGMMKTGYIRDTASSLQYTRETASGDSDFPDKEKKQSVGM